MIPSRKMHLENLRSFLYLILIVSLHKSLNAETIEYQRFEKQIVATDLIQPMELAIAPDETIFLIELG